MPDEGAAPAGESFALAVDLGTGGPKVGLVSLAGEVAWKTHVTVPTTFLPDGGAVQDAEHWWSVITEAVREALAAGVVSPAQIEAVSVTGQWASTVPVDANGIPVGQCVLWMDTRGGRYTRKAVGGPVQGYSPIPLARWVRHTGGAPSTSGADPIGHMLHLENDEPAVARAARWYIEPVDYLSMRFTGVAAASHASMTGAWLTDNRRLDVLEYDPALLKSSGVPADKLPPLRPTASIIGTVRGEVASALGLPEGVKVVAGTPDLHSAAAGAGTMGDFESHLTISTTSWISCPVPFKKTDPIRQIASVPGLTPDRYLVADNHDTAGICLQWLRDNVVAAGDGLFAASSEEGSPLSYDALTTLAAAAPPGSGDVIFTPWLAGGRSPFDDHNARAGFHNLSLSTTRAHMVRAVLEGVAYHDRWLLAAVERFVDRRLDPIRMIGGGATSDLWCQIHADVLGRTMERVAEPLHANLRGAALLAGLALGRIRRDEVKGLVPVDATFKPDRSVAGVYDRLYAEFPRLYRSQKAMFGRLNGPR